MHKKVKCAEESERWISEEQYKSLMCLIEYIFWLLPKQIISLMVKDKLNNLVGILWFTLGLFNVNKSLNL